MIYHGDCLDVMATLDAASVDAIVTDPPYDLLSASRNGSRRINNPDNPAGRTGRGFMGKTWDGTGVAFRPETWAAAFRVAKPSAYLLAFGGTRTYHRMAVAIEDAGWVIRDCLVWAYASGFPKGRANLKPAWEPIVMGRKPGPLRMLNIDECRIPMGEDDAAATMASMSGSRNFRRVDAGTVTGLPTEPDGGYVLPAGRWPANVILTDPIFDGDAEGVVGGGEAAGSKPFDWTGAAQRASFSVGREQSLFYDDSGTYSRFFLIPKADRGDREPILGGLPLARGGVETMDPRVRDGSGESRMPMRQNVHPTVKPTDLMRHLVRLVTPPGGLVLDPFLGSGTTAIAAEMEGFRWIGIEREAEYVAIAEARLNGTQRGLGLPA